MAYSPVTTWLLEKSRDVVRELERVEGNFISVEPGRLKIPESKFPDKEFPNIRLIVPQGIKVFTPTKNYRCDGQIFFTASEGRPTDPAYASVIWNSEVNEGMNFMRNIGNLFKYGWFDVEDTRFIYHRLVNLHGNAPIYARSPNHYSHPLANIR